MNSNKIPGFYFHCHHDELFEWVYDYDERVNYIKKYKPIKEQELRLRLLKMIPEDRIPVGLVKAREAYGKAVEAYGKEWKAYGKAGEAYYKARVAYGKAWEAYDWEKLHKELCPDCTWDGKTIFPKEEK